MNALRIPRLAALTAIAVLVGAATVAAIAESYRGLLLWALHHSLTGIWAALFPLQIDTFLVIGELALFVLNRRAPSNESFTGWGLSVAVPRRMCRVPVHG